MRNAEYGVLTWPTGTSDGVVRLSGVWRLSWLMVFTLLNIPHTSIAQDNELALTVYTNGLGLVSEIRSIDLDMGRNTVQVPRISTQIDPTSVRVRSLQASGLVSILEQRFSYDLLSGDALLSNYTDKDVDFYLNGVEAPLRGRLLSLGTHVVLKREDGRVELIRRDAIQRISVPDLPEGLVTEPTLTWLVENRGNEGSRPMEISYLTQGVTWHAEYSAVISEDETVLMLSSWASIENESGMTFENADLTLVAGEVNRSAPRRRAMGRELAGMSMAARASPQLESQQMFEYHAYALGRKGTIENNASVQLSMLDETDVKVSKHYVYDGIMTPNGVQTRFRLENRKRYGLGLPLPRGTVRLYQEIKDGKRQFIGEDNIRDLAEDETVYLTVGHAFDISGERTQTGSRQPSKGVVQASFRIVLRNQTSDSVTVKVIEHLKTGPNWRIREPSHLFEKLDARTIEFEVPVRNNGETEVTYTVEYRREI